MRQLVRTRPAVIVTLLAILGGLFAIVAVPSLATRASAATVTVLSESFESSSLGALWKSDNPTDTYVADPENGDNTVLSLTDRSASHYSVQTPSGLLESGTTYAFSVRVRLADPEATAVEVQLQDNNTYGYVANLSVSGTAWTTLTGNYTPPTSGVSVYINAPASIDLLVDDFVVTTETEDEEEPEPCVPSPQVQVLEDFEDGNADTLQQSGEPTLTVVDDASSTGDKVLQVAGRSNNYDGVSTKEGDLVAGVEYTVSVKVKLAAGETTPRSMRVVNTDGYGWIGNTSVTASDWVTLTGAFTAGVADARLYIGSDPDGAGEATYSYLVDDFTVTYLGGCDEEEPEPCEPTVETIGSYDFESAVAPWGPRGGTTVAIDSNARTGSGALLVTNRTQNWHGTEMNAASILEEGTYTITAWVKLPSGASGPEAIKATVISSDGTDPIYTPVGSEAAANAGDWTQISGDYVVTNPVSVLYFEATSPTASFLVDDITITGTVPCDDEEPEPCEPLTVNHTSLTFDGATLGSWEPNGSPTLAFVSDPEDAANTVLSVAERTSGYFGITSPVGAFDEGVLYTVTARVRTAGIEANAHFTYNEPATPSDRYDWVGTVGTGTASEWQSMSGTFTPGANASSGKLYMEVEGGHDYLIDDILITYTLPCGETPPPGTVLLNADFEDGTLQGWVPREGGAGPHTVEVQGDDTHGGDYAAIITDRTSQGSGIGFDAAGVLEPAVQYEMSAWVKFAGSPTEDIVFTAQTGASTFSTLGTFTGVTNGAWSQVTTKFTVASGDRLFIYFETPWEDGATGNITPFMIDDITVSVPEAVVIQDLTPIMDTVDFPVGVAIDSRETAGPSAELLLKHFDQITPENFMKPEAWYNASGEFSPNEAEIDSLMDFAQENDLGLYGHVLVWHSQTPAWFFNKSFEDSTPLTNSEEDKQILRERLEDHIFNVAEYLSDDWGEFGSSTNPLVAFDVVNEVIDDSSAYTDGMRRSRWYDVLGEEFVHLAFEYADEAFNDVYAADSADRPVALFINDYNTEQSGKRNRYLNLIDRLLDAGAPVDGIGHQFHVSLSMPVENLNAALSDASSFGLMQAVTELDVTTGTPESEAKFIDQGYYYRDAFEIFRAHEAQMFSVTVWGLIDSRSWRDANGGPLVFDDDFQAKPAYYGIVEGQTGDVEPPLPPRLRAADIFAGTVPVATGATDSLEWDKLPLKQISGATAWQARWAEDHLTVYVTVDDATVDSGDLVEFSVEGDEYYVERDGDADVDATVAEGAGGWSLVAHLPLTDAVQGDTVGFDVRAIDDGDEAGWNSTGVLGTLTLVEALSYTEVGNAQLLPEVDGRKDWIWLHADKVTATKNVSGSGGALGTFYHLWSENTLYVYAEIADPTVDVSGSDPWTQDSVEIYVDPGNVKNGSYRYDDTQIRINADNVVSFGTGDETFQANRVDSATKLVPGGYIVEASISLLEDGGLGSFQGVDFQVNDASGGARDAIRNWADPTGAGYQSTARWGVAQLVAAEPLDVPDSFPLDDEDLTDENDGCVLAPSTAAPGDEVVVELCPEYAGDTVDVYVYSVPQLAGTGVATGGFITVTIPTGLTPGVHKIAVYDEDGFLIGWTEITIVLADGSMADTGAHVSGAAFLAVALVLAGAASLWTRQRLAPMLHR